jgi:hypothetical protein
MILAFVLVALLPWESTIFAMAIVFPSAFIMMSVLLIASQRGQSDFLQIVAKWLDLIQDINHGICKDLGISKINSITFIQILPIHVHTSVTHYSISYAAGLIFMVEPGRMHPERQTCMMAETFLTRKCQKFIMRTSDNLESNFFFCFFLACGTETFSIRANQVL